MASRLLVIIGIAAIVVLATVVPADALFQDSGNNSIPRPNSGAAPESATDRGGAFQLGLLALIALFPIVAIVSVRRQGRRRAPAPLPGD